MKKLMNPAYTYIVKDNLTNKEYTVVINKIKNDVNGNPRFDVLLILPNRSDYNESVSDDEKFNLVMTDSIRYRISDYGSPRQIAEEVVREYLNNFKIS